jgi:CubicO group peptidase (beta-lactamase class C family)
MALFSAIRLRVLAGVACVLLTQASSSGQSRVAEMPRAAPLEVGLSAAKLAKVKASVQGQVDKRQIAGAVVLVARHGKIGFWESFGKLDLRSGRPMPLDAIFRIYSMTKPITSVAALTLVEGGKIELDDPVGKYLPELKELRVYAGKDRTIKANRPATIRDLMRHTSGFTYGLPNGSPVDRLYIEHKVGEGTLAEIVGKLGSLPLQDQPGTRFNYSVSTDVLGRVIEVVSGEPLDKFLSDRIFRPLDMRDTGFTIANESLERFVTAYIRDSNGVLHISDSPATSVYRKQPRLLSGGGGLLSTARDYCRFCQMLLNGGELNGTRLLRPETIIQMMSNQLPSAAMPLRLGGFPLHGYGFGLGVMIRLKGKTGPTRFDGEYSWSGSSNTYFWVAPKLERIVIVLQQVEPIDLSTQLQLKPLLDSATTD